MSSAQQNSDIEVSRKPKGKLRLYLLLMLIFVSISILIYFANDWAKNQEIKKVNIYGNKITNTNEIKNVINEPLLYCSKDKIDFFSIKSNLQKLPYIKNAFLKYNSSNELTIEVIEREPIAIIIAQTGNPGLIDKDCNLLPYKLYEDFPDLPLIRITNAVNKIDKNIYCQAIDVIKVFKKDEFKILLNSVSEIIYDSIDKSFHALTQESGINVIIGDDNNLDEKLWKLLKFWFTDDFESNRNKLKYIDLRWKDKIVVSEINNLFKQNFEEK